MKKLLVANRKGGVGKTTTVINLSLAFSKNNKKVLLVDLDTQGHLQIGLGYKKPFKKGIHRALYENDFSRTVYKTSVQNINLVPASINFDSSTIPDNIDVLKVFLDSLDQSYDICIIDTPPTSDNLLNMAMFAADFVIAPMQVEYLSFVGTVQFLKFYYQNASKHSMGFNFLGIVPTMCNLAIVEQVKLLQDVETMVGKSKVLQTIRKDSKLAESFKTGIATLRDTDHSKGRADYENLAMYISSQMFGVS